MIQQNIGKSILIISIILVINSCHKSDASNQNIVAPKNIEVLKYDSLLNAGYYDVYSSKYYRLKNGNYVDSTTYEVDPFHNGLEYTFGRILIQKDFDNDGAKDALVTIIKNDGGSGVFVSAVIMLNKKNVPVYADCKELGDRIKIDSVSMVGDTIFINSLIQGPDDAYCCPTMPYVFKLRFLNNKLQYVKE